MKAVGVLAAVTVLTISAGRGHAAQPKSAVQWHTDFTAAKHVVSQAQRPLLILFTMDNCVYCQRIKRLTYANPNVASTLSRSFVASVVNGPRNPGLAERYGVRIYPTTVIVSPTGQLLDSIAGYVGSTEMHERLAKADKRVRVASTKNLGGVE